jgi:hypothetical protein
MPNPVEEFLAYQGLDKEAQGIAGWAAKHPVAATAISGVAAPLALMAAQESYQEIKGLVGRARGYKNMLAYNPKLKKMPAGKTKALFNTLHNAAPDLARDPVVASSFVNRMAYQDEYVDPRTLADLGSAQQRISRKGTELPVAQITTGMMGAVGGVSDAARRERQFEHQRARDAVAMMKDRTQALKAEIEYKIKGPELKKVEQQAKYDQPFIK